ncbi:hypothetical protein COO60DRAFT_1632767 [Scenedesmus sp. NREL 46B-D3]|nr:hypothetical protein COO60DRAFT_1632767 [Scenedesmus sp. NREL 46B-D3]
MTGDDCWLFGGSSSICASTAERYSLHGLPAREIPGLYPIITEQQEQQNSHLVSKIVPLKEQYVRLLSDLAPEAAAAAAAAGQHASFAALNKEVPGLRCAAVYGSAANILQYLVLHSGLPSKLAGQLAEPDGACRLQPGITVWCPAAASTCSSSSSSSSGRSWFSRDKASPIRQQPSKARSSTAASTPDLYVMLVGSSGAFCSPNSSESIVSYLRYAFELCSDLLLVVSAEEAASFEPRLYFLEDHEAKKLLQAAAKMMEQVQLGLDPCGASCSSCYVPCLLPRGHSSGTSHDCLRSSHHCMHSCVYCATEGTGSAIASCKSQAGHPGPHSCGNAGHECGERCSLAGCTSNCAQHCCLPPGHEGDHLCGVQVHLCGFSCSLDGCCGSCSLHYGHDPCERHRCTNRGCPRVCQLCGFACACSDHFHPEEAGALHLCGNSHPCSQPCAAQGLCEIRSELRRERKVFKAQRGDIEYEHITGQVANRHPCPCCGYRCTKPHGHEDRHETQHGNMRNTYFVSDAAQSAEIDVGERKYVRGEQGMAETCDNYCSVMGRGHVHVLPCDITQCDVGGQATLQEGQRRHARCRYSNGRADSEMQPKDELVHDAYWEAIAFRDPCTEQQRAEFRLCGATCGSHAHDQDEHEGNPLPRCLLPLWHAPVADALAAQAVVPAGTPASRVSQAGHVYACDHGSGYSCFHTVLVIDRSGSMADRSVQPASPELRLAMQQHRFHLDNIAGVVCEAALAYMRTRQARSSSDRLSCITFDDQAHVVVEAHQLASPATCSTLLRSIMAQALPRGGTDFGVGLDQAFALLRRIAAAGTERLAHPAAGARPVIILLTDSGDWHQAATLQRLQEAMANCRRHLPDDLVPQVHTIGYGRANLLLGWS